MTIRYLVIEDASAGAVWTVDVYGDIPENEYAAPYQKIIVATSAQDARRIRDERRSAYPPRRWGPVCAGCGTVYEHEQLSRRPAGTDVNGSYRLCEPCWTRCPYLGTWPGGGLRRVGAG